MEQKFREEINRLCESRKNPTILMISRYPTTDEFSSFFKELRKLKDPTVQFYLGFDDFHRNNPWGKEAAFNTFLHFKKNC